MKPGEVAYYIAINPTHNGTTVQGMVIATDYAEHQTVEAYLGNEEPARLVKLRLPISGNVGFVDTGWLRPGTDEGSYSIRPLSREDLG